MAIMKISGPRKEQDLPDDNWQPECQGETGHWG